MLLKWVQEKVGVFTKACFNEESFVMAGYIQKGPILAVIYSIKNGIMAFTDPWKSLWSIVRKIVGLVTHSHDFLRSYEE